MRALQPRRHLHNAAARPATNVAAFRVAGLVLRAAAPSAAAAAISATFVTDAAAAIAAATTPTTAGGLSLVRAIKGNTLAVRAQRSGRPSTFAWF